MPFGLINCPVVFIKNYSRLERNMDRYVSQGRRKTVPGKGATIVMDDTFIFAVTVANTFRILKCVCIVPRKYNLTWKLKKSMWFPDKV